MLILDTAGRLHIDEALMTELAAVRDRVRPHETLLVADALTGQDAVNLARSFHERIGISGIVLTRIDGDARGGAALSMRAVTGQPIKLVGTGEKLEALEPFHPDRMASRILGMGDVVSLVEKVSEAVDQAEAEKLAAKMQKGSFDLDDLASQLRQMRKMGGMSSILGLLPGVQKVKQQLAEAKLDDRMIGRQIAIVSSMTPLRAAQSEGHPRLAQAPDRGRRRPLRAGGQQAPEAAPADADDDEAGQEDGPAAVPGPRPAARPAAAVSLTSSGRTPTSRLYPWSPRRRRSMATAPASGSNRWPTSLPGSASSPSATNGCAASSG